MSQPRTRAEIEARYKWQVEHIYPGWDAWRAGAAALSRSIDAFAARRGTLASGADALLAAFQHHDAMGQLAYRVWYYPALRFDENQRDNDGNARRQEAQALLARMRQATSWFNPELLRIPLTELRRWMDESPPLAVYRFATEDLFRQQAHVLDEKGEHLLSLASRFSSSPSDAYSALSTADIRFPAITLSSGETVTVTYGQYRAILATRREQRDRARAFEALHETFGSTLNSYAALYNAVCQRDWFKAQARGYASTLEAALDVHNIPPSVVENLIATTRAGVEPLRRYHRLRRARLGVEHYHPYDFQIPIVQFDRAYPYDAATEAVVESTAPLGDAYRRRLADAFTNGWVDVYETDGKRSGAYSAPVYGVHPYVLMNYNDTLDALFTLAHELGHSMHTVLAHELQPFVYSSYTIFVAEVPSTLSEALLLEHMLARTSDPRERSVLLQHAIDEIAGTFYTQVMFADFELQVHRLVEAGRPITADVLGDLYASLLDDYYGDAVDKPALARMTWARIPHFFNSPYYVYQYATCFASAARLSRDILHGPESRRAEAVGRFLSLLASGGSDDPMTQLAQAGVDLSEPDTVRAVPEQLDRLVDRLEAELSRVDSSS